MAGSTPHSGSARDLNINLRVTSKQKNLIAEAAELAGKSRSEFMLEAACREAESVLLDQVYFTLEPSQFRKFLEQLDSVPETNPKLSKLLRTKAPWES